MLPIRFLLATLVALVACGGRTAAPVPALPSAARLTPGTTRYQVVERRHIEQQYQGEAIATDATTHALLTVTVAATSPGFALDIIVDSVGVAGDAGMPATMIGDAIGARLHAPRGPAGAATIEPPATSNAVLDQIALGLHELLARLPPEGASPGTQWRDTLVITGRTAMLPITIALTAEHRAEAWTGLDADRTLPVVSVSQYTLSGEGERAGQWLTMTGAGRSVARRLVTADGTVVHGVRADTLDVVIELAGSGLRIPLTQTRTDTVRRVFR